MALQVLEAVNTNNVVLCRKKDLKLLAPVANSGNVKATSTNIFGFRSLEKFIVIHRLLETSESVKLSIEIVPLKLKAKPESNGHIY